MKSEKILLMSVVAMLFNVSAFAELRYVSPSGNDADAGTKDKPWKTVSKAAQSATAGDTVLFRAGTYKPDNSVSIQNSGTANAWITFKAHDNENPVIDGGAYTGESSAGKGLLTARNKKYIRIEGLSIKNSYFMGIYVENCENVEILKNYINMTFSCGIGVWGCAGSWCTSKTWSKNIKVIDNEVDRPNMPEMCRKSSGSCDPPMAHEGISVAAVDGFEVAYNHVHHGRKEGIDCKETSRNGTIHHNYVHHHLERPWTVGIYVDAWFGELYNVEVYENLVHDCDDGISIAAEDGPVTHDIKVHHNVLYNFGWRGITLDGAGKNNMRRNIWIYNNTVYNAEQAGIWVQSESVDSVFILNNICAGGWGRLRCDADTAAKNIVIDYNLLDATTTNTVEGTHAIIGDPKFKNAGANDFSLQQGSPAVDAGHPDSKYNDPDGSRCDIGAIPYGSAHTEAYNPAGNNTGNRVKFPLLINSLCIRLHDRNAAHSLLIHSDKAVYDCRGKIVRVR